MRCAILINRKAGTVLSRGARAVVESLRRQAKDAGAAVEIRLLHPASMELALERARSDASYDAVIVGGGDGSISSAAALFADSDKPLGILPLGTMNLFARSLRIPIDLDKALTALLTAEPAAVDLCCVNGRVFTHHVALGLHPTILRKRETLPYRGRIGKIWASLRAYFHALRRPPTLSLATKIDGKTSHRRTSTLVVSNNSFIEGLGHLPYAENPQGGHLAIYVANSRNRRDLLRLSSAVAMGAWVKNPLLESHIAEEAEIALRRRRSVLASVDGELIGLASPLHIAIRKGALIALMPKAAEDARAENRKIA
ncbi:MAG TPA: diacylglycerol kinase family protein [Alphaproteobacteria bacterium]|nr:diacylglycerol kinase family protein [Alphaproteobacteria bacterium]